MPIQLFAIFLFYQMKISVFDKSEIYDYYMAIQDRKIYVGQF